MSLTQSKVRDEKENRFSSPLAGYLLSQLGLLAAQALTAIRGRHYVIPDDVKYLAVPVLAHRLISKTEARLYGRQGR